MADLAAPRLALREHAPEDLAPLAAMLSDPRLTHYLPDMRKDAGEVAAYLAACARAAAARPRLRCNLAAVDRDGGLVGSVELHLLDGAPESGHWGLGYFVRPDIWGRGWATEAVRAALDYIFARGAVRVSASCLAENLGSRRVLEKCGFVQEGLLRRHAWHDGEWKDRAVYGLLAADRADG